MPQSAPPLARSEIASLFARACDEAAIVVLTDLDGVILECNEKFCEISGYARHELIGANHRLMNSGVHPAAYFREMFQVIGKGETWRGAICNRRKSGELYWLDTTITPQLDASGRPVAFLAIRFDITAHKQALADLAEARARAEAAALSKGRFLATMSHELRTPLTGVIGLAELLAQTPLDPRQTDYVTSLMEAARALHAIVNDVLNLAKAEAATSIRLSPVDPAELFRGATRMLSPLADKKGIVLRLRVARRVPRFVRSDAGRLRQILVNLVGNALKFTEAGRVDVTVDWIADQAPYRLRVDVLDTGPGFTSDLAERIFEPFEQAENSASRAHAGAGLGLAISAQLIQAMNGTIVAENRRRGGARFWFEVPAEACAPDPAPPDAIQPVEAKALRVLITEDNPTLQRLIRAILESAGHRCEVAINGAVAIEMMRAQRFDVCLMDLRMPVMDGVTATRIIGEQPPRDWPTPPIIALSADVLDGDREHYARLGFQTFLPKPICAAELLSAIAQAAAATPD